MTHSIDTREGRNKLADALLASIDTFCQEKYGDGHRNHLGASLIGKECSRYLWYVFRWCKAPKLTGQQLRLFNRGHLEEIRFVEWLRGIGCGVSEFQADGVTQHRISGVNGHFGGGLDGFITLPPHLGGFEMLLAEFKTSNDKRFKVLASSGVAAACPEHFQQMSTYGVGYHVKYAIYICINKNTDELYVEICALDWELGADSHRKAEDIILAETAPMKISADPTFYKCKWCDMHSICHEEAPVERNCRSCADCKPSHDGQWWCDQHQQILEKDFLPKSCDKYRPIA